MCSSFPLKTKADYFQTEQYKTYPDSKEEKDQLFTVEEPTEMLFLRGLLSTNHPEWFKQREPHLDAVNFFHFPFRMIRFDERFVCAVNSQWFIQSGKFKRDIRVTDLVSKGHHIRPKLCYPTTHFRRHTAHLLVCPRKWRTVLCLTLWPWSWTFTV